jgi:hypothetical protein
MRAAFFKAATSEQRYNADEQILDTALDINLRQYKLWDCRFGMPVVG